VAASGSNSLKFAMTNAERILMALDRRMEHHLRLVHSAVQSLVGGRDLLWDAAPDDIPKAARACQRIGK
jgi:hypothetical protein